MKKAMTIPFHMALLSFAACSIISGCSNNNSGDNIKEETFTAYHNFRHIIKDDIFIASLLFENTTFIGNLGNIQYPDYRLIAGDRLIIKHTGEIVTLLSSPSQTYIQDGELKEYYFIQTRIIEVKEITATSIKNTYSLRNENVILDEEGHFTSIDEYQGSDFYLTFDAERVTTCPEGAWCEEQLVPIAGIYAFNPRP